MPYVRYTVRPGDNLWRIASKHKVSINDIRANNRITNDVVEIGEVLTIPNGNAGPSDLNYPRTPSRTPSYVYDQPSVRNNGVHIVRSGESLGAIAKSYGVSTASMASANRLNNPNSLLVGQRLTVPGSSRQINKSPVSKPRGYAPPPSRHEAVPLPYHTLAQRQEPTPPPPTYTPAPEPPPPSFPTFPTTPSPAPAPIKSPESSHRGVLAYRVVKGDNIDNVASLFGTTPQKLRDMNRMSGSGGLKEGDEIIVPAMSAVSVN